MRRFRSILVLVCLALVALSLWVLFRSTRDRIRPTISSDVSKMAAELGTLLSNEQAIAATTFAEELEGQVFFASIESFWDRLNRSDNALMELRNLRMDELVWPRFKLARKAPYGIGLYGASQLDLLTKADIPQRLAELEGAGWQLARCEFRHNAFESTGTDSGRSKFYVAGHLTNDRSAQRAVLDGEIQVEWKREGTEIVLKKVDASYLNLRRRAGPLPFQQILALEVKPPQGSYFIDPMIIQDLDNDGYCEVILAAANLLLRRKADGSYASEQLCPENLRLIFTAIIADFTGNGTPDLLTVRFEGVYLYEGTTGGKFETPARLAWTANPRISFGQVLTSGDIDRDGDLDLWLGQYKPPYSQGQMPTPYHNANDGYPSFLLQNNGSGTFKDVTYAAGLGQKRWRRSYSGSLADLDSDSDLDLVVVSDFAGIDAYENQGNGIFKDLSEQWFPGGKGFGMAHLLTDLNSDGRPDFFMVGMNSPTVDRLTHLGLLRPGRPDHTQRQEVTYGNRLYLGADGSFRHISAPQITRTGWSWGAAALDSNNDGFKELFIVNGHESKDRPREYEPEFWLHDIYVGDSQTSMVKTAYFQRRYQQTRGQGASYGGYELNRFYLNENGTNFIEAAHLLGIASQADSRNAIAEDLDNDGLVDLLFTTFEVWPKTRQMLYIYKNTTEGAGNWAGFSLSGVSPALALGAKILVTSQGSSQAEVILTGDSYRSQASFRKHFGLGQSQAIGSAEIHWTDGRKQVVTSPAVNQWQTISR